MRKNIIPALLAFSILFTCGAMLVHAQVGGGNPPDTGGGNTPPSSAVSVTISNPFTPAAGDGNIITLFKTILNNIVIPIGGVLCVLAFIYAGFLYVTAGGSKGGTDSARNMLINAVIGTVLLLGAGAIAAVIDATIKQLHS